MRANWRQSTIGEVCDVVNGGTPKTGVSANWGGPHMWITPAEMGRRADPYVVETDRQLTDAGLAAANLLPPYSVILSSRAPIGHLVINTVPMATNQGCKGLAPKPSLHHKYLFYYLGSIVGLLNDLGTGATFKELSGGKLKEVPIPLPPLPEQQRIVAILDEAFAGLATATANAEKNLRNARELFESYLNSIFTRRCAGWATAVLGKDVRFIDYRGKTPPKMEVGIRLITAKNVKMNRIQSEPQEFIDESVYDGWMTRGYPQKGDVLFTTEAPLGNVAQLDTDETVVIGQRLITMQPDERVLDRTFLKYALMSPPKRKFSNGVPGRRSLELRQVY